MAAERESSVFTCNDGLALSCNHKKRICGCHIFCFCFFFLVVWRCFHILRFMSGLWKLLDKLNFKLVMVKWVLTKFSYISNMLKRRCVKSAIVLYIPTKKTALAVSVWINMKINISSFVASLTYLFSSFICRYAYGFL